MADVAPSPVVAVHKFGGSSLADPGCYRRVAALLLRHSTQRDLVVVSAAGKTTNKLIKLQQLHRQGVDFGGLLSQLRTFQSDLIQELLDEPQPLLAALETDLATLQGWLAGPTMSPREENRIVALGECWSSRLLAALLSQLERPALAVDARRFLLAEGDLNPQVDSRRSADRLQGLQATNPGQQLVITGFICANKDSETLLLGRNGSDYSATLVANLAGAGEVNIWTDVAGVYSADPNLIHEARLIEQLSLAEATELGRLGNPVLHHRTLQPLAENKIALRVRSSFDCDSAYTEIGKRLGHVGDCIVNGLARVVVFRLSGAASALTAMIRQLAAKGLTPLTQCDSHQGVSLSFTEEAAAAVERELQVQAELQWQADHDHGLVSLLDAGVSFYRVLYGKLFDGESAYPVILSDNGLSLSCLVKRERVNLLSHLLHHKIYRPSKHIGLVLCGAGNIGSAWLSLFGEQQSVLEERFNVNLTLAGIVRSSTALVDFAGIANQDWQQAVESRAAPWDYPELLDRLAEHPYDELIVLDISASESLSDHYHQLLEQGCHLISANKFAGSSGGDNYNRLQQTLHAQGVLWRHNATVGAGLPVQYALSDLRHSGDQLKSISGVFSGTLSWLFEYFDGSEPFSQLVLRALELGITEPDPRDDLSGKDMQRKLLILAREAGVQLDIEDIGLESMVPEALASLPRQEFLERIAELDAPMAALWQTARAQQSVLRYVAAFELDGQATVGLQMLPESHPFANLTPSDNVFMIKSQWYDANPLVIRGPGAGREVTAAAVQSDLFHIVSHLAS